MDKTEENEIIETILKYGKDILCSDVFRQAASETHHVRGTVLDHTLNVCVVSLRLARQLKNRGIKVSEKDLVHAALCHDLGMIGRDRKYKGKYNAWEAHPEESARIAREILPDLTGEAEEIVRSHMWPLSGSLPRTNEGVLLCIADKYASMEDWKAWVTKNSFSSRIKEQLDKAIAAQKPED